MSIIRKERGKTQNIYLIECSITKNLYEKEYLVMGYSGNVYTVTIKREPTCTCPDFETRGNRCKHIYFILIRIMKVAPDKEDKEEFTKEELLSMFTNIPKVTNNLIVDKNYKKKYKDFSKKGTTVGKKDTDDLCPICLDELENGEDLLFCEYSCGKSVHNGCFDMWKKFHTPVCVYCRSSMEKKKYINLLS